MRAGHVRVAVKLLKTSIIRQGLSNASAINLLLYVYIVKFNNAFCLSLYSVESSEIDLSDFQEEDDIAGHRGPDQSDDNQPSTADPVPQADNSGELNVQYEV